MKIDNYNNWKKIWSNKYNDRLNIQEYIFYNSLKDEYIITFNNKTFKKISRYVAKDIMMKRQSGRNYTISVRKACSYNDAILVKTSLKKRNSSNYKKLLLLKIEKQLNILNNTNKITKYKYYKYKKELKKLKENINDK